jgi:predicted PurR-regulated permease PerM
MRVERQVLFWIGAAVLLILTVALLKDILLPFIIGIAVAYFLSPIADRLVALGINRTLASALIVALGAVLAVLAIVLLAPVVAEQARGIAAALPGEIDRVGKSVETWGRETLGPSFPGLETSLARATQSLSENWAALAGWAASSVWSGGKALFNFVSLLLITPLVVFYVLVDWHPMMSRIDGWLPRDHAESIRELANEMNEAVAAFVRGQGTVCLVLGTFYALGLSAIGLNYGLIVGLATGILAFVPFVGWALGLMAAVTLAAVQFWPDLLPIALVAGVLIAGMALDAGFLSPKIVGSKIGLHPVWLIFALIVFSYLFGFIGTLIAVPLAAAVGVLVRFCLRLYLNSSVYRGHDAPAGGGTAKS